MSRRHGSYVGIAASLVASLSGITLVAPVTPAAAAPLAAVPLGTIDSVAGRSSDGLPAASAFLQPNALGADAAGNVYIIETAAVRRVAAGTGVLSTVAGNGGEESDGDGGPATAASIRPAGIAVAANGDLYVSDAIHHVVRKVSAATGIISAVAGTGVSGSTGNGGPATSAQLVAPFGLALDSNGVLYIADRGDQRIRKVVGGVISAVAGTGSSGFGGNNQPALTTALSQPTWIAVDSANDVYFTDSGNSRIRKITYPAGNITTIAGTGTNGFDGDGSGPTKQLRFPEQISFSGGFLYIADAENQRIRRVNLTTLNMTTVAGTGAHTSTGDGGPASLAAIATPVGLATTSTGVYVTDGHDHVRVISTPALVIQAVGGLDVPFSGDGGPATSALISINTDIATDLAGNLYIADGSTLRIRKVSAATGVITTIGGNGEFTFTGDGPAATTSISPASIAVAPNGDVWIDDVEGRVRVIRAATGIVTTVAGTGQPSFNGDGPGTTTNLGSGTITLDAHGDVYLADHQQYRIRKISGTSGAVTTLAGNGSLVFDGDGPALQRSLVASAVVVDTAGDLYVTQQFAGRLRKVTIATGLISTVAGTGVLTFNGDGPGPTTNMTPSRLAFGPDGSLYLTDSLLHRIRRFDVLTGSITTIAGDGHSGDNGDQRSALSAHVGYPDSIATDRSGHLFVRDRTARIRAIGIAVPATPAPVPGPMPGGSGPAAGYHPVTPERLLDTRDATGTPGTAPAKRQAGTTLTLQITGAGTTNVPATASAVAINVAITDPDAPGFLTIWPCDQPRPLAANLNHTAGQTIPNLVIAKLAPNGTICIYTLATTHIVADINGWS